MAAFAAVGLVVPRYPERSMHPDRRSPTARETFGLHSGGSETRAQRVETNPFQVPGQNERRFSGDFSMLEILPARRTDLVVCPLGDQGRYVVKDPRTGAYFHIGNEEHFLLMRLDGQRSVADLRAEFGDS